jgi:hypothetical protein
MVAVAVADLVAQRRQLAPSSVDEPIADLFLVST